MDLTKNLSTFQVAKICGVFHTTVIYWCNQGKLPASHTVGGHRRIKPEDLIAFMKKHELPIPDSLYQRGKSVLIVEDDAAVLQTFKRAMKAFPELSVETCQNGIEALMHIGRKNPDLVLLDVRIPGINGLDVCRVLHASDATSHVRVIAVSGETLTAAEEAGLASHADAYLRKPVSMATLRAKAAELLELETSEAKP